VQAPAPVLPPEKEKRFTRRQAQLMDKLEQLVATSRLTDQTMSQIAARVKCSLRTLYGISPTKDELLLAATDRRMRRIGRDAMLGLTTDMSPLEALRSYLLQVNRAIQPEAGALTMDFANVPGALRLIEAHRRYVVAVLRSLLDQAVAEGEIVKVDTAAVAYLLGSLAPGLALPGVAETLTDSPKATADAMAEVVIQGLLVGKAG
jgi:AcrR family transcriptional regulator